MHLGKTTSWPLLIVGVSLVVTSCTSNTNSGPVGLGATRIAAEYQSETKLLTLPSGVTFPDKKYDAKVSYEPGVGRNDADSFWYCKWTGTYLNGSKSSKAMALSQLQTLKDKYIYTHSYDQSTRAIADKELAAASLGDPGPLGKDYRINCG